MRSSKPPAVATWLLEHLQSGTRKDYITGDLIEAYQGGRSRAWYWKEVFAAITVGLWREFVFGRQNVKSKSTVRAILFGMFVSVLFVGLWRVVSTKRTIHSYLGT
jgi:hypothetical protein